MQNRAQTLGQAPLRDLLAVLLRQHKRLLMTRGVELTEAGIRALAEQIASGQPAGERVDALRTALIDIAAESEQTLARWNLTFNQALATPVADMPGWETTAEFLELANEKSNAELRIASAAALLAALGDLRYADHLLAAITHDPDEIETVTARRVLSRLSGIAPDAPDWQAQINDWLGRARTG
ncbi:MAG TPA: hypothetical protein VKY59_03545 [Spirillospora sp.]|nr:hypothetical protein [Spirillospora sp.]